MLKGQSEATVFSCPECRADCDLAMEDVEKLPTAFFMNRLKSVYSAMSKDQGQTELICELCNSSTATVDWFCRHCAKFVCELCARTHQRLRIYKDHVVISKSTLSSTNKYFPSSIPPSICIEHDRELSLYCTDCKQSICRDCILVKHKNHSYDFVKKMAAGIREELTGKLAMLRNDQKALLAKSKVLAQSKIGIFVSTKESSDFVNRSIDELMKHFEMCRNKLLEQIETESQEKLTQLSAGQKDLAILSSNIQSLTSMIEKTIQTEADDEIVSITDQVLHRVDQQHEKCTHLEKYDTTKLSTSKEVCVATIAGVASTCIAADPSKCSLEIDTPLASKKSKMRLLLKTNYGQSCHAKQIVDVAIRPLTRPIPCEATMTETAPGVVEISYTPRLRGRHVISVSVNGAPITGSPFQFHVEPILIQMLTPAQTIPIDDKLGDIAVTHKGEILATLPKKGTVIKLDKDTMRSKTVASGLDHPVGIAIGKNNEVYVTESQAHRLRKFDQNFQSQGTTGQQGSTLNCFNAPGRLAVNYRGEVIVCDQFNSRVQIFDSKLQLQRWYAAGRPLGVACGKKDEIFVTESTKKRVCRIYDKTLGLKEFCKDLNSPRDVFVDKDYVYVTEANEVAVYKLSGQYVCSLGNDVLKNAGGITGDEDGFLYVCDKEANAIFVF